MDIRKLMCPESVAIVGATDKPGFPGNATRSAQLSRVWERTYFINPKRDELLGKRCYHALSELPEVVDCLVLGTPAHTVPAYLEAAGELGIGAAVVFASGFGEERTEEARRLAEEVRDICRRYDIALCGPNCIGVINAADQITVSAAGPEMIRTMFRQETGRGIAAVAQSGYITGGFVNPDAARLAYLVSAGNCTACSIEEYLCWFAEDDRVNCIAAYIEGIKKPALLEKALRTAALRRKPVVVLKACMTEKGSFAAASHTGSLAGDYATYESVFRKYGVVVVKSLQELTSTARMFSVLDGRLPPRPGVGAVNFSGGENTMCADTCARYGIALPAFRAATEEALRAVLPSYATASNPLDATTTLFTEDEKVRALFSAISADPAIGLITLGDDVGQISEPKDFTCARIMGELSREGTLLPAVIIPSFEKPRNPELLAQFEAAGIPVLGTGDLAYQAVRHLMDFACYDPAAVTLELALPERESTGEPRALSEAQSKAELTPLGVPVPAQALAASEAELDCCLAAVPFPVVMKVESPDILHKTEAGGVRLNIRSAREAHEAYRAILDSCRAYRPEADITGVMIQEMIPAGTEVILGVKNDRQFGPMLLAGLGGVFTEVFRDTALYPCPLGKEEALAMLRRLKGWKLLAGYRGAAPRDTEALADLMVKVSDYAAAHRNDLKELDLNPVVVFEQGKGVCAADALIVRYEEKEV